MSETVEEKEDENVENTMPTLTSLSKEEIEENKARMQQASEALTPPEGYVLKGLRSWCPIHGDITRASKMLPYTIFKKNEETGEIFAAAYSDVICLACASELWRKYMKENFPKTKDGNPDFIRCSPIFQKKEVAEEEMRAAIAAEEEALKQKLEELQKKKAELEAPKETEEKTE